MASKTNGLRLKIARVLLDFEQADDEFAGTFAIDGILKACKESGLMFTRKGIKGDDVEGACICKVEEIETNE